MKTTRKVIVTLLTTLSMIFGTGVIQAIPVTNSTLSPANASLHSPAKTAAKTVTVTAEKQALVDARIKATRASEAKRLAAERKRYQALVKQAQAKKKAVEAKKKAAAKPKAKPVVKPKVVTPKPAPKTVKPVKKVVKPAPVKKPVSKPVPAKAKAPVKKAASTVTSGSLPTFKLSYPRIASQRDQALIDRCNGWTSFYGWGPVEKMREGNNTGIVAIAHNYCGGSKIWSLKTGNKVKVSGYKPGTYRVVKVIKHYPKDTIYGNGSGTITLRTCEKGTRGGDNRVVVLRKA